MPPACSAKESLDTYSQDELADRIELLETEIARVDGAPRQEGGAPIDAADALFGKPST